MEEEIKEICENCYQITNKNYSENNENSNKMKYKRFSEWIHCMCVVTFDLELGQAMELIYPDDDTLLTEQEKMNICYLAFPDSNSGCMGDTQYHIRLRLSSDNTESLQLNNIHKIFHKQCIDVQKPDLGHYWGFVYFRQKKDTTIQRGYFQKSFIILTRLPFFNLFNEIVSKIAPYYFNDGISILDMVYDQISKWPTLKAGEKYDLNLFDNIYQTIIPKSNSKIHSTTTTTTTNTTTNFDIKTININENFNKKINENLLCKYCKELIIINNDNNTNINTSLINDNKNMINDNKIHVGPQLSLKLITSVHEIDIFNSLLYNITQIYTIWELVLLCEPIIIYGSSPTDCSNMVQSIISLINPLQYFGESRPYFTIHDSEFKEFTSINNNNNNQQQLSSSSSVCNNDVLTSSSSTLCTNNNNNNKLPPSVIIGVTNPFFIKLLQNWPHIIKLPDTIQQIYPILTKSSTLTGSGSSTTTILNQQHNNPNKMKKLINNNNMKSSSSILLTNLNDTTTNSTINNVSNIISSTLNVNNINDNYNHIGLHTKYKSYIKNDKNFIKKIQLGMKMKRPQQIQSAIIRRHFLELTQSFMIPLERYMASLMPLKKDISPFKSAPNPQQFKPDEFLSKLELSGPQLTTTLKGNWKGLYKRFFKSANFKGWYDNRHKELKHTLQTLQLKALSDADLNQWAQGKQEVEIIDMILKLKQKLKLCSDTQLINDDVLNPITRLQLNKQLDNITKSLPDDLKIIINNNLS